METDTICAESTPSGRGAISIVRVSGPKAHSVLRKLANQDDTAPFLPTDEPKGPKCALKKIFDPTTHQPIDECLVIQFWSPYSFTGEDSVEFQLHGNPLIVQQVLRACADLGVRMAEPGEFTRRAVLNDRLSLAQAESLGALIEATHTDALHFALGGLKGLFQEELASVREEFLSFNSTLVASVDFPEERLDAEVELRLQNQWSDCLKSLEKLLGRCLLRDQLVLDRRIVLLGRPNAGKSSLFNALLGENRSIVSSSPGTTRDFVSHSIVNKGNLITLVDTAGVRESGIDAIENEGIDRTWQQIQNSQLVLYCVDGAIGWTEEDTRAFEKLNGKAVLLVETKSDLTASSTVEGSYRVSIKSRSAVDGLLDRIVEELRRTETPLSGKFLASQFQIMTLRDALGGCKDISEGLVGSKPEELLLEDLKSVLEKLESCIAPITQEEALHSVFSRFCIGK